MDAAKALVQRLFVWIKIHPFQTGLTAALLVASSIFLSFQNCAPAKFSRVNSVKPDGAIHDPTLVVVISEMTGVNLDQVLKDQPLVLRAVMAKNGVEVPTADIVWSWSFLNLDNPSGSVPSCTNGGGQYQCPITFSGVGHFRATALGVINDLGSQEGQKNISVFNSSGEIPTPTPPGQGICNDTTCPTGHCCDCNCPSGCPSGSSPDIKCAPQGLSCTVFCTITPSPTAPPTPTPTRTPSPTPTPPQVQCGGVLCAGLCCNCSCLHGCPSGDPGDFRCSPPGVSCDNFCSGVTPSPQPSPTPTTPPTPTPTRIPTPTPTPHYPVCEPETPCAGVCCDCGCLHGCPSGAPFIPKCAVIGTTCDQVCAP